MNTLTPDAPATISETFYTRKGRAKLAEGEVRQRNRAREYGVAVVPYKRIAVIERDRQVCHLCDQWVKPEEITFDHVLPLSKGGGDTFENVKVAHRKCNMVKCNKV